MFSHMPCRELSNVPEAAAIYGGLSPRIFFLRSPGAHPCFEASIGFNNAKASVSNREELGTTNFLCSEIPSFFRKHQGPRKAEIIGACFHRGRQGPMESAYRDSWMRLHVSLVGVLRFRSEQFELTYRCGKCHENCI